jgi:sporulation protein YlmC with PRC-barrel domain
VGSNALVAGSRGFTGVKSLLLRSVPNGASHNANRTLWSVLRGNSARADDPQLKRPYPKSEHHRDRRGRSMNESTKFIIGSEVACSDGVCGHLRRVVVDPIARALTHLVVEPGHRRGAGHLVPIDLVTSTGKEIQLRCTKSEYDRLETADETRFLPGADGTWDYEQEQMLSLPHYGLPTGGSSGMGIGGTGALAISGAGGMGGRPVSGLGGIGGGSNGAAMMPHARAYTADRVPVGEVEVRRGDHVHATDGSIGRVQGLVVDPSDHHVTHVLLDEGHLWGKKQVAIPIGAVKSVEDDVRLNLTKDQVRELLPIDLDHPE